MSQYENPYYPNGGAGGGGGYLAGSPFSQSQGSPGGSGRQRSAAAQALRPVVLRQLLNATQAHTDAEWQVDGIEIGQITCVATVMSVQTQTTNNVYTLDDGTGRLEARHWIDTSGEGGISAVHPDGTYVRVTGALKMFGNKRYINATNIYAFDNKSIDEAFFHMAEVCYVTLALEKGPPPGQGGQTAGQNGQAATSAYTAQPHNPANNDMLAHFPPIQRKILQFMMDQPQNDEGVHVAAIARAIGGDAGAISSAIDTLMDDGHVFSTIDESHFKVSL